MANHTFAGVVLRTEWQGNASVPIIPPGESVLVTEHVPGGDLDVTQDLGRRGAIEFTVSGVLVEGANWAALVALQGQTGTLALIANPTKTATLQKIGGDIRYFAGNGGLYRGVSLTFLVG
jgi:hypothetical protein